MRSLKAQNRQSRKKTSPKPMRGKGASARPHYNARASVFGRRKHLSDAWPARLFRHIANRPFFRRPMLAITLMLIVGGGATGLIAGGYVKDAAKSMKASVTAAFATAGFSVSDIAISGNTRTPEEGIRSAIGVSTGDPIFTLDPATARARILTFPWVAEAEVRRSFPDRISVSLIEKRPFALWRNGGTLAVVERSGAVITREGAEAFADLPFLIGNGAPELAAPMIDALSSLRAVSARVRAIERISERRWNLILENGVRVNLPETGWEAELAELEKLIVDEGVLEHEIDVIDLRYPDRYVFRLHNGDSRPVPRDRPA